MYDPTDKEIPAAIPAERATLGSLLVDRDAIIQLPFLAAADFFLDAHRHIYAAMLSLYLASAPTDFVTLCYELHRHGKLDVVGGAAYLAGLAADTPTAAHVVYYARIVADTACTRRLIAAGGQIAALGYHTDQSPAELVREAQRTLDQLNRPATQVWQSASALLSSLFDTLEQQQPVGLATGCADLDSLLKGLRRQEMYIVAARPGVGKSAWVLQVAHHIASSGGVVGFISLEMSAEQLMLRLLSQHSGIPIHDIESGRALGEQRLSEAFGVLAALPFHVIDTGEISPATLRLHAQQLVATAGKLDILVVDYIQIMDADVAHKTATETVTAISRAVKRLAKELDIPILAVAQLNRASEARADHRPNLGDLRQSGQLEQDAAAVILMYREIPSNSDTEALRVVKLNVAKHRHGATGEVQLRFVPETMQFQRLVSKEYDNGN